MREKKWVSRPHLPIWPLQTHFRMEGRKEGIVLFNDALNTFYLWLYGAGCSGLELAPRC